MHVDKDGSGSISRVELGAAMRSHGMSPTDEEIDRLIAKYDKDGSGTINFDEFEAILIAQKRQHENDKLFLAPISKGSMLNDLINTGVMAAVIGGFALSNLQNFDPEQVTTLNIAIYIMNVLAVHANTCSSLASALLYMVVNNLVDEKAEEWRQTQPWKTLIRLPTPKFVMGTAFYLFGVLLLSWRDMMVTSTPLWRWLALGIGAGSVGMVITTASIVGWGMSKSRQISGDAAFADALG